MLKKHPVYWPCLLDWINLPGLVDGEVPSTSGECGEDCSDDDVLLDALKPVQVKTKSKRSRQTFVVE